MAPASVSLKFRSQRIVSTSVTLTGTLLAIGAPVIASGASRPGSAVTDSQGFFSQWGEVARQRGVIPLYQGEANAEAIMAADPDLIVIAGTGGDSALKLKDQLAQIAPVLVVHYDRQTWQELARELGRATGNEGAALVRIDEFERKLAEVRSSIHPPSHPVTALTYYEDGSGANVWTAESAQGQLLHALGFQLATVPASAHGRASMGLRQDIIEIGGERFAEGLNGESLLLFSADQATIQHLRQNRFLQSLPAVRENRIFAAGLDTFRLDYYSSMQLLDRIAHAYR